MNDTGPGLDDPGVETARPTGVPAGATLLRQLLLQTWTRLASKLAQVLGQRPPRGLSWLAVVVL
jgi:hypothetical protein